MKRMPIYVAFLALMLIGSVCATAQSNKLLRQPSETKLPGGVSTLYALDPLANSFCFRDGQEGHVVQQNEIRNRCSDLDFNTYNEGNFTVGVEGGRVGSIIDLGTDDNLREKYGYSQSKLAVGEGFVSLRVEDGKVVTMKDRKARTVQELTDADELFAEAKSLAAAIKAGHIYLIRLTDTHDKAFQLLVKLVVLAYTPDGSVTIRWQIL